MNYQLEGNKGKKREIYFEKQGTIDQVAKSLKPVMEEASDLVSKDLKSEAVDRIGNWLASPRTINSFQQLKYSLLCWNFDQYELARGILDPEFIEKIREEFGANVDQALRYIPGMNESVDVLFEIAARLKILQLDRIKYERQRGGILPDQLWFRVEYDNPQDAPRAIVHDSLESLEEDIEERRHTNLVRTYSPRLGLVIGDFRVGLHPGHHELIEHAKVALGREGRLVVVTPSKRTIEEVHKKTPVWDDKIRLALIANNRFVSDVLLADMGESYWDNPDVFWEEIWSTISPDLVFLGELNHPLEPKYRANAAKLGGLLLIDDSIKTNVRSGDLLFGL